MTLLVFMLATGVAIVRLRNLFAVVMLTGIFSLLGAAIYVLMDAVDVAFTEAAVGAGVSTVLMLGTLALTTSTEKVTSGSNAIAALLLVSLTGGVLVYGTLDMPVYGDRSSPLHHHVVPRYLEESSEEIDLPNVVTSILASYRGYDTLGETFVIFTAAAGVLALIGRRRRTRRKQGSKEEPSNGGVSS
jgi:multicomponent Na+:H+ antiporter subunit B